MIIAFKELTSKFTQTTEEREAPWQKGIFRVPAHFYSLRLPCCNLLGFDM
jgi:hypothetical protein